MMSDLTELRRIAEAATPGEWTCPPCAIDEGDGVWIETSHDGGYPIAGLDSERIETDGYYIATFDPPTVLALLNELAAAREVVEAAREAKTKHGFGFIEDAVDAYDAATSERTTS